MLTRRQVIAGMGAMLAWLPMARAKAAQALARAMEDSALIYITPIQSSGKESQCQSEVWFAHDGIDMFVCTGTDTWRARAAKKGLNRARVWIGDLGVWTSTKGKYRKLPSVDTQVTVIDNKDEQARVLKLFGQKYTLQWVVWGRRFRAGLDDGSRTLLRYRPIG
jgi:hypothetical protein